MLDIRNPKVMAAAILLPVLAVGATWTTASSFARPELVTVTQQGCGAPMSFELPLRTATERAPTVLVTYGPIDLSAADPVFLTFDPALTAANEVSMADSAIVLPTTFATDRLWPQRIRVNCRDGAVNSVRFERDRTVRNFNVVRTAPASASDTQT